MRGNGVPTPYFGVGTSSHTFCTIVTFPEDFDFSFQFVHIADSENQRNFVHVRAYKERRINNSSKCSHLWEPRGSLCGISSLLYARVCSRI